MDGNILEEIKNNLWIKEITMDWSYPKSLSKLLKKASEN